MYGVKVYAFPPGAPHVCVMLDWFFDFNMALAFAKQQMQLVPGRAAVIEASHEKATK